MHSSRRIPLLVALAVLCGLLTVGPGESQARSTAVADAAVAPDPAAAPAASPDATTVTLKLASAVVAGCTTTRVEIWVNDVADLYAVDVHVAFDPAKLNVVDVQPSVPGVQIEPLYGFLSPGFIIKRIACNVADPASLDCATAGKVWYSATQLNPTPPASGSGALAAFTMAGVAEGISALDITYQKLSSPTGGTITATAVDGSIGVQPPAPVQLAISAVGGSTARLTWTATPGASAYRLYRSTLPHFAPVEPAFATTSALTYDDVGALGGAGPNKFYLVRAVCGTGLAGDRSRRVGGFGFSMAAGS